MKSASAPSAARSNSSRRSGASAGTRRGVKSRAMRPSTAAVKCSVSTRMGLLKLCRPRRLAFLSPGRILPDSHKDARTRKWNTANTWPTRNFQLELREPSERRDAMNLHIRKAVASDVPRLREVIDASVRGLQAQDYSPRASRRAGQRHQRPLADRQRSYRRCLGSFFPLLHGYRLAQMGSAIFDPAVLFAGR